MLNPLELLYFMESRSLYAHNYIFVYVFLKSFFQVLLNTNNFQEDCFY